MEQRDISTLSENNIKVLNPLEISPYLTNLNTRLTNLSAILTREGDKFVEPYLRIVRDSIETLILKYQIEERDRIDFSLTMTPKESGFPTIKDFYLLLKNKGDAEQALAALPKRDEIVDVIRRAILWGESPINGQIMLKRHNFYSGLSTIKVLEDFHINEIKDLGEEGTRKWHTLAWSCIEKGSNLPVLYRLSFTQDKNSNIKDRLDTAICQSKYGFEDLRAFASLLDREIAEIHPKLFERCTIGPYYNGLTVNSDEINTLLDSENTGILKFTVDKVVSSKVQLYGNWVDRLMGNKTEREIFTPNDSEMKMVVPFRIKQKLVRYDKFNRPFSCDEFGKPCRVYGVTNGGEIIG